MRCFSIGIALLSMSLVACIGGRPPSMRTNGRLVVILGSSTAAGRGASSRRTSWAALVERRLRAVEPIDAVWNLARGGLTTYHVLPRPASGERRAHRVRRARNIERALAAHPYAVVVSLPSNDTRERIPEAEQMDNLRTLASHAERSGARFYVLSPQPRNFSSPALRESLVHLRATMLAEFGTRLIDVWPDLVGPFGELRADLDVGDGTHVNDTGHRAIAARVLAANVLGRSLPDAATLPHTPLHANR